MENKLHCIMPGIRQHMEISEKRTGKDYKELHEWMDPWGTDVALGKERHDITKIPEHHQYVKDKWGEEAAKEFLLHIKEDLDHKASRSIFERAWHKFFE